MRVLEAGEASCADRESQSHLEPNLLLRKWSQLKFIENKVARI
jgi:hypothetical protein